MKVSGEDEKYLVCKDCVDMDRVENITVTQPIKNLELSSI